MTQGHKDTRNKRIIGFTLMELMVVIGIIAIVGVVIGPGLKKAYEDFKIKGAYEKINTAMSALRNFYLIFNETPSINFGSLDYVDVRLTPFLPSGWVNVKKTGHWGMSLDTEKDYHKLNDNFLPLYKFTSPCFQFGNFQLTLATVTKPYYWDDLLEMCDSKGYTTKKSGYNLYIYLPEKHSDTWFR